MNKLKVYVIPMYSYSDSAHHSLPASKETKGVGCGQDSRFKLMLFVLIGFKDYTRIKYT